MRTFTSVKTKGACEAYTFYRAVGCPKCDNTGYRGRTGVHELLEINEPVREAILARKTSSQIRLAARESADLVSMAEDGFYKAAQGITTLQEVLRLVFVNACDASVPYNAENLIAYCDGAEDSNVLQLPKVHNRA
jgi:type IV pilus assembly protein PilB